VLACEKPTIETIALWRRVRRGPQELLFQDRGRKLGLFPTDSAVFAQPEGERFEILKTRNIIIIFSTGLPFAETYRGLLNSLRAALPHTRIQTVCSHPTTKREELTAVMQAL